MDFRSSIYVADPCHKFILLSDPSSDFPNLDLQAAAILGENVRALNVEIAIEHATVKANCLNTIPVVPGINATGMNTAIKTREVAIIAPVSSPMASRAAFIGVKPCSNLTATASTISPAVPTAVAKPDSYSSYEEYREVFVSFSEQLPQTVSHLEDVDALAPGIRPIRASFSTAIDTLRKTISVGSRDHRALRPDTSWIEFSVQSWA